MTVSSRFRTRRRNPVVSPVLRPMVWSALLGAAVAAALATPVYADPPLPNSVPDTGSRPVVAGALQLPGAPGLPGSVPPGAPLPNLVSGPLAAQIYAAESQVAILGDELLKLRQTLTDATAQRDTADRDLKAAQAELERAQRAADTAAAEALKVAAALPPGQFGSDLHGLGILSRIERGQVSDADTTAPAREAARARAAVQFAGQSLATAQARVDDVTRQFGEKEKAYQTAEAKLRKLRDDNKAQLIELEKQQEAAEQRLGEQYLSNGSINGLAAHPRAMAAVRYALAQLGDPYLWAAEGPDRFDCSGLVWAAYRSKGADYFDLPRVSRDQYYATRHRSVSRSALLPGDLIFFASGNNWQSIHHMGMYIGGGKMVHAPTTGDVVKVSTVRWSRFYAATRIFGAVPAPTTP
ncbi:C40 family peptidase, partial [Micromonospora echinofusca]